MTNIAISKFFYRVCVCVKIFSLYFKTDFIFQAAVLDCRCLFINCLTKYIQQHLHINTGFFRGGRVHKISKKSRIQSGVFFQNMREVYSEIMQYITKFDVRPAPRPTFDMDLKKDWLENISDIIQSISMLFLILRKNMYSPTVGSFEGLVFLDVLTRNLLSRIAHNEKL